MFAAQENECAIPSYVSVCIKSNRRAPPSDRRLHTNAQTSEPPHMKELNHGASPKKRRRIGDDSATTPLHLRLPSDNASERGGRCCRSDDGVVPAFDIFKALDARMDVAIQIVASSGGVISHWNDAFAEIARLSPSPRLTIFDLVDPRSLPSLYGMLALSLHNVDNVDVEEFPLPGSRCDRGGEIEKRDDALSNDEAAAWCTEASANEQLARPLSPSHLSITLPCKVFQDSSTCYVMTLIFMINIASTKRCFLGILTPEAQNCCGVDDDSLLTSGFSASRCSPAASRCSRARPSLMARTPESIAREQRADDAAYMWQELPRGKMLRIDDDLLCQMLLGTTVA